MRTQAIFLKIASSVFVLLTCLSGSGQTTVDEIQARLVGQPLLLRGFWMNDKLHFGSTGKPVENYTSGSFTESAFDAQKVKLSRDHLTIEGQRVALAFSADGKVERMPIAMRPLTGGEPEKVTIVIDGPKGSDFSRQLDAAFASHLYEITPSLPDFWQQSARKLFPPPGSAPETAKPKAESGTMHIGGNVTKPVVLNEPEAQFSATAHQLKYSGSCMVYLLVGTDGVPSHVSIFRPVGLGLDEKAVEAVAQYRFNPATLDGKPVTFDLYVNVNFQVRDKR